MAAWEDAVAFVLVEEDGLSDNPDDPGKLTKYGISSRAYPDLDIRNLTEEDARAIYRRDLWDRFGLDRFPDWLSPALLDSGVNPGPGFMPRAIQRSLNRLLPRNRQLKVDAILGPVTLRAVGRIEPGALLVEFLAQRAEYYALRDGLDKIFGLGWYRRLLRLHAICLKFLSA